MCLAALVAALGTTLLHLGVRAENVDLNAPPATAAEQARQDLAIKAHRIAASAELSTSDTTLAESAQAWEKALGGVWVPWPEGAPEGYANPELELGPYDSLAALDTAVWDFSQRIAQSDALFATEDAEGGDGAAASTDSVQTKLTYESMQHAIILDRELGASTTCPEVDTEALITAIHASADFISEIETARQWIEYGAATASEASADQIADMAILQQPIDAALAAGVADTRPVMVAPPTEQSSALELTHTAVTKLIYGAPTKASTQAAISYACALQLELGW